MLEHGTDYLLTVKANQPTLRTHLANLVPAPPASAEAVDFLCAEQVALLRRKLRQHRPETVALVTSLPTEELNAAQWLPANRAARGIESGLHQRLDLSHHDDQCRVRQPRSMGVVGLLRRFSNSLCLHWCRQQNQPHSKTTAGFFSARNAAHLRDAIRGLQTRSPSFQTTS